MDETTLARMANDIARNFAALGEQEAVVSTAEHIRLFWDPRMKTQAGAMIKNGDPVFSDIARKALEHLARASADNG